MKQIRKMTAIMSMAASIFLFSGIPQSQAREGLIHPEVGFLIIAPDRDFLGNKEAKKLR